MSIKNVHYYVGTEGVLYKGNGCEHEHEQYRQGNNIVIEHHDEAYATDNARLPDRPGFEESVDVTDQISADLIQFERYHADYATATDSARRRHTIVGKGTIGWEPEIIQHPYVTELAAGAVEVFMIEDFVERRLIVGGIARVGNPRGRAVRLTVTMEPDPYNLAIRPIVLFDAPLPGVGFTDVPFPISEKYDRTQVKLTSLETDRTAPVHILITGWSARESKYPARYPEPGV